MAGGRAVETSPIFVFRMTFYVHRGSGQARVSPRRWLSLSSRAKAFTLQGTHRCFVGDSVFHTSLRGAPLLVGEEQKWYNHQILQKVHNNLMRHDYIIPCTVYTVVQQYVLVGYCFHLTSTIKAVVNTVGGFWPIDVFFAGYLSFFFVPSRQTQTKARL